MHGVFLGAALLILPRNGERRFADVNWPDARSLRTVLLRLTGAAAGLFGTFVARKGFFALGGSLPQYDPVTPPKWLGALLGRVPSTRPGGRFAGCWSRERADEAARWVHDEQPRPAGEGAAASG